MIGSKIFLPLIHHQPWLGFFGLGSGSWTHWAFDMVSNAGEKGTFS